MRVQFFTNDWNLPDDWKEPAVDGPANGEYGLNVVPVEGDQVSFDEGDHEYRVHRRLLRIDPATGHTTALIDLRIG